MQDKSESVIESHFDIVSVSKSGRATWPTGAQIAVHPEGEMPGELGFFAEAPEDTASEGFTWTIRKPGEPVVHAKVLGKTEINGVQCVEIEYRQQSPSWGANKIANTSWNQTTLIALDAESKIPQRVKRVFQMKQPEMAEIRSIETTYHLDTIFRYRGPSLKERAVDFHAAHRAQSQIEEAMTKPDRERRPMLATVKNQLRSTLTEINSTPYRTALKDFVKLAERLESQAKETSEIKTVSHFGLHRSRRGKNFVARNLEGTDSVSLTKLRGSRVVLVFVDPSSQLSVQAIYTALKAAQGIPDATPKVLAMCVANTEAEHISHLRKILPGDYAICSGRGIDKLFGAEGAPHIVVLDNAGLVQTNMKGFGPELMPALVEALSESNESTSNTQTKRTKETFLR